MSSASSRPFLLVDGYNIIGAWSELKILRNDNDLETARLHLVEALIDYSASQGFKTEVVFDAQYQKTPEYREPQTNNLSVYYTAYAQTADTYIEKVCANHARQSDRRSSRLIVATSDRAQQLTVSGYGAQWRSAQQLARDVSAAKSRTRRATRPRRQAQGRFLFDSLDAEAQKRLSELRLGR